MRVDFIDGCLHATSGNSPSRRIAARAAVGARIGTMSGSPDSGAAQREVNQECVSM